MNKKGKTYYIFAILLDCPLLRHYIGLILTWYLAEGIILILSLHNTEQIDHKSYPRNALGNLFNRCFQ